MLLDIHLEGCDDKGEQFRKVEELEKPFIISIPPVLLLPNHEFNKNDNYINIS